VQSIDDGQHVKRSNDISFGLLQILAGPLYRGRDYTVSAR
jgi:hypothetical protein